MGTTHFPVEELAEKMNGTFYVQSKKKRVNAVAKKQAVKRTAEKPVEHKNVESQKKRKVHNLMEKPFPRRQGESKTGRTSFPNRKPFRKNQKRMNPNLIPIPGGPGKFLWNSPDGKVKNLRLPCRYHEDKGADVYECKNSTPRHCFECSKPGFLAPPIRECKGNHQWKEDKPSSSSGRSNNSRRRI